MTTLKEAIEKKFEFKKEFYNQALSSNVFCVFLRSMISRGEAKDLSMQCLEDQNNQLKSEVLPILLETAESLKLCNGKLNKSGVRCTNAEKALERLRKWSEGK